MSQGSGLQGPGRPPRLRQLFQRSLPPLYFVTLCTHNRRKLLACEDVHNAFKRFAIKGYEEHGIAIGRYVVMPDHVHVFVRGGDDFVLSQWGRMLKRSLSAALEGGHPSPHWQKGFFDHIMRSSESYTEKWHYVCANPVRAGLVDDISKWPYQGEIVRIEM